MLKYKKISLNPHYYFGLWSFGIVAWTLKWYQSNPGSNLTGGIFKNWIKKRNHGYL